MRTYRLIALLALVLLAAAPTGVLTRTRPAAAQNPCDGLVEPRLQTGAQARVITTYGLSLKNDSRTGAAGAVEVRLLPYDTVATVVDGYRCNLGYVWWQLQLPDGTLGWAAEGGPAGDYYLEPVTVGLHVYRPSADRATIAHYFVTPQGAVEARTPFAIDLTERTPQSWQLVEVDRLRVLFENASANCPERLAGTPLEGLTLTEIMNQPLPATEYDSYPAPSGDRLVLVRHDHLRVPRCDTVIPERVGMSNVSILNSNGAEIPLFPFPQHGSIPDSIANYEISEPGEWNVYLDQVIWSPHSKYVAFTAAYRDDDCAIGRCFRFHVYVANLDTGELYTLGEGRHVGWTAGGEGINVFGLTYDEGGQERPTLNTMRPNGFDRQIVWLPGGAVYVSDEQFGLGFPWNASGTRVMVANAGEGEVMLFDLASRDFTSRVMVPDKMPQPNRLSVDLVFGETSYLWTSIRGDFAVQDVDSGRWEALDSTLATIGVAPVQIRPFGNGTHALIDMVDGSAYVLDIAAGTLARVPLEP